MPLFELPKMEMPGSSAASLSTASCG
jgi:hypothetical protein